LTIEFLFVSFKKIFHITTQNIYLFICLIHLRADLSSSLDCVSHYPSYIQLFYIFSWVYVSLLRKDFLLTVNYFGWIGIPNSNVSMCHLWSWFTSSNLSSDILQVLPVLNVTLQQWALDVDRHCESSLSLFPVIIVSKFSSLLPHDRNIVAFFHQHSTDGALCKTSALRLKPQNWTFCLTSLPHCVLFM
jgi:hypothetical protein